MSMKTTLMKINPLRVLSLFLLLICLVPLNAKAATFDIPAGDVAALIAAMNAANDNGTGADVINLETGTYTFSAVDNSFIYIDSNNIHTSAGPNALPPVFGELTINGNGSVFDRASNAPDFRFLMVIGNLTVNAITFTHGRLLDPPADTFGNYGGAIFTVGDLTVHDSVFSENEAHVGGAIANRGSSVDYSLTLAYVTLINNYADNDGGGLFDQSIGSLVVESSTISNNSLGAVDASGAGISVYGANPIRIHATSITGNQGASQGRGGGIYIPTGYITTVDMSDSTISNNSAGMGGAFFTGASTFHLTNLTIADNQGGGIMTSNSTLIFSNVLLSNNQGGNCTTDSNVFYSDQVSHGNNLDTDATCQLHMSSDLNNVSAQIAPLADNGGATLSRALLVGSPAINHGNPATCSPFDQRWVLRDGICDIGAVEAVPYSQPQFKQISPANGSALNDPHVHFQWTLKPDVGSYDIEVGTASDLSDATPISVLNPVFTSPSLFPQRYYWRVRYVNFSGVPSAWTDIWSVTVMTPANAAPQTNFYQTAFPLLTWNRVSWATGYMLEMADNPAFNNPYWSSPLLTSDTLSIQPTQPLHTGQWYWRVKARRPDASWGGWSASGTLYVNLPLSPC